MTNSSIHKGCHCCQDPTLKKATQIVIDCNLMISNSFRFLNKTTCLMYLRMPCWTSIKEIWALFQFKTSRGPASTASNCSKSANPTRLQAIPTPCEWAMTYIQICLKWLQTVQLMAILLKYQIRWDLGHLRRSIAFKLLKTQFNKHKILSKWQCLRILVSTNLWLLIALRLTIILNNSTIWPTRIAWDLEQAALLNTKAITQIIT